MNSVAYKSFYVFYDYPLRACGTHSKGHDCLGLGPSMAVRLSPSVATDAISMGTTSPYQEWW
jgi:hypothetical protein